MIKKQLFAPTFLSLMLTAGPAMHARPVTPPIKAALALFVQRCAEKGWPTRPTLTIVLTKMGLEKLLADHDLEHGKTGIPSLDALNANNKAYPLNITFNKALLLTIAFRKMTNRTEQMYHDQADKYWQVYESNLQQQPTKTTRHRASKRLWVYLTPQASHNLKRNSCVENQQTDLDEIDSLNSTYHGTIEELFYTGDRGIIALVISFEQPVTEAIIADYQGKEGVAKAEIEA